MYSIELSYILAELFNKCLKESCFPDCWKVLLMIPVFKNVGEKSTAKNYCPVSLLSVVSKVFEKLVNIRIVDHLENVALSHFQYSFRSSWSNGDLLTGLSNRIARVFNGSGATWVVALDRSRAFGRVWLALFRDACYGMQMCPHTHKSIKKCDKLPAQIKLWLYFFTAQLAVFDQDMCLFTCCYYTDGCCWLLNLSYSQVWNKHLRTLINFWEKLHPRHLYSNHSFI